MKSQVKKAKSVKFISNQAINLLKKNLRARTLICLEANTTHSTVGRWVENGDKKLTMEGVLKIIEHETGLSRKEIVKHNGC